MSINDLVEKIKPSLKALYYLFLLLVVASIFFVLGRLSVLEAEKTPIKIYRSGAEIETMSVVSSSLSTGTLSDSNSPPNTALVIDSLISPQQPSDESVIGSKSGKKYYYPWCGTVSRIKPENQVKFSSIAEAKSAGYTAGGNCKGLK